MDADGCTPMDGSAPSPMEADLAEFIPPANPAPVVCQPAEPAEPQQAAAAPAGPAGLQLGELYHPGKYIKGAVV